MFNSIALEIVGDNRMACAGCAERVERALGTLQEIGKVRASAETQRINVLFDAAAINQSAITQAIARAGYQTKVVTSSPSNM